MSLNTLDKLAQGAIAKVMRSASRNYGCTVTVQRATASVGTIGQTSYTYAADAAATSITATLLDIETALARKIVGLVEGCFMLAIIPRRASGMVAIAAKDRILIQSGPFTGRTFEAVVPGNPGIGAATHVALAEPS